MPALLHNVYWVPVIGACGCTGVPCGAVATMLALRKDPGMGAPSGFAVAFIAAGIGALLVTTLTALFGFELSNDDLDWLRSMLIASGESERKAADTIGQLQDRGEVSVVVAGGFVALTSGFTGAVVAAWRARRLRAASPPALPPRSPPPA
jgi:hypothetical protein